MFRQSWWLSCMQINLYHVFDVCWCMNHPKNSIIFSVDSTLPRNFSATSPVSRLAVMKSYQPRLKVEVVSMFIMKNQPKEWNLKGFFPTNLKNLHCLIPPKKNWVVFFSDPCQMSGDKINVNHLRSLGLFAAKALLALQVDPFLSLCSTVSTFGIVHSFVLSCHISKTISTCFYSSIFDNEMKDVG